MNRFRNIYRIHVSGSDIPDPIDGWDKLSGEKYNISERLLDVISGTECGYESPTPIQMQSIPLMLGIIQIYSDFVVITNF